VTFYLLLKYLHVLSAVVAVGFNLSYGFWLARARKDKETLLFVLRSIKVMDSRIANPAYMILGVTGPLMVWINGYSWSSFWIWMSVTLLVLTAVLGITVYSPLLKNQIAALESKGPDSTEYRALERKATQLGLLLILVVAVIIFLMVTKFQP